MKLFTFATSPYARKVRIVLDYKGIAYEPDRAMLLAGSQGGPARGESSAPKCRCWYSMTAARSPIRRSFASTSSRSILIRRSFRRCLRARADADDRRSVRSHLRRGRLRLFSRRLAQRRLRKPKRCRKRRARNAERCSRMLERELDDRDFFCGERSRSPTSPRSAMLPLARAMRIGPERSPAHGGVEDRMREIPAVAADHERAAKRGRAHNIAAEFEGPDGRIHWRDSRLEWPVRHGFIDLVAREFHAGKMLFPPDAS